MIRDARGSVLVEFAITLPVLLTLFLGVFVISDTISCYRKVTVTARTLADLVGRNVSPSSTPSSATLAAYINSAQLVLTPFDPARATLEIDELRVCDATHAYVMWSKAQIGTNTTTPSLSPGSVVAIPNNLVTGLDGVTGPLIPTSPDGSNVCLNTTPGANKTVVGTAGAFLLLGRVSYDYRPPIASFNSVMQYFLADQIYMIPRLN